MYTYTLEKQEDGKEIITKKGIEVKFEMKDVYNHESNIQKAIKELEGKCEIEKAKKSNIEEHHPFVKEMSEKDLFTVHMYQESNGFVKVAEEKLAEFKKMLEEYEEEKKEIAKQTGIELITPTEDAKEDK